MPSDRRKDNDLRCRVNDLRDLLQGEINQGSLLERTLQHALELTNARKGIVARIHYTDTRQFLIRDLFCYARQEKSLGGKRRYTAQLLMTPEKWLNAIAKRPLLLGKIQYIDSNLQDHEKVSIPRELLPLESAVVLPLMTLDMCYGVIVLINDKGRFTAKITQRISPLISACGLVYRTHSTQQPNLTGLHTIESTMDYFRLSAVSHDAAICVDQSHNIIAFNPAAERIFKVSALNAIGRSLEEFIPSYYPNDQILPRPTVNSQFEEESFPQVTIGKDSGGRELVLRYQVYTHLQNDSRYTTYILRTQTERADIRHKHLDVAQRLTAVTDLAKVGILQTDASLHCVYVNDTWCAMAGMSAEETIGTGWFKAFHTESVNCTLSKLQLAIKHRNDIEVDIAFQSPFGACSTIQLNARPSYDSDGLFNGMLATFRDVTKLRNVELKLRQLTEQDGLTGLSNRNSFMEKLQRAIARAVRRGPLGLVYLDLDGFTHVNDTLGHEAGDYLLYKVSERLQKIVRCEDMIARLGGDEFGMIMEGMHDPCFVAEIIKKVLDAIAQPIEVQNQTLYITASAGIAIGDGYCQPAQLLRHADTALRNAKSAGRNTFRYFTPEMTVAAEQRLLLHTQLHQAMKNNEFFIVYQPQHDIATGQYIGSEALIRWQQPGSGIRLPEFFLKMLEESKLIARLGIWILEQSCLQQMCWLLEGAVPEDSTVSVNVSASQIFEYDMPEVVGRILEQTGLPPENLVLEITETAIMRDVEKCRDDLFRLKEMGVEVSLDDFGTGYSSLALLSSLPIDQLKIDLVFMQNLFSDSKKAMVARTILVLGKQLDLDVVAEGIDSADKLEFLNQHGCQIGQGFYFSRPICAHDMSAYLGNQQGTLSYDLG